MGNTDPRPERLYANYLEVGWNAFEVLLDFGAVRHEDGAVRFHSGIITSPGCADLFLRTLQTALREYEKLYGPIPGPAAED